MMDISAIRIQENRLRQDLLDLGRFGEFSGRGIKRTALSDADLAARHWFKERMREAGLEVHEDAAANIIGRMDPAAGPKGEPCVATGSHIDTVAQGGKFDGALGICAGLEALRAIRESGLSLPCPCELLVFTDEEGSHFAGTFGSRAMFSHLQEGEMEKSRGAGMANLAQDLRRMGKDPEKIAQAGRSPSDFRAFLELHIEQGPVLEEMSVPIGIVDGIVHLGRYLIRVEGKSGHAGTTPMHLRDDALVKAAGIVTAVNEAVRSAGSEIVGTIGEFRVQPGVINIIPGEVEMALDLRSMKEAKLASVKKKIEKIVHSTDQASMRTILTKGGVKMDPEIMMAIELSCRERGIPFHRMGSGAGHDAMTFPMVNIPAGIIFIPCVGGKSHCPDEDIRFEDATLGAQVLADTIVRLAFRDQLPPLP
jgi:N-carbamoyl-L-amino-acid hydrolase